jgi:hypothetical protein
MLTALLYTNIWENFNSQINENDTTDITLSRDHFIWVAHEVSLLPQIDVVLYYTRPESNWKYV